MPGYVHILGMHAALEAVNKKSLHIDHPAFQRALRSGLEELSESTRRTYARATQSPQPNNLFQQTLLACATAGADEFGTFEAAALKRPLSEILRRDRDIPDYNRHLKAFCTDDRGPILEQVGTHKNYRYRFLDPMMQSYVIIRGLSDGLLRWRDG
jgi:hypothetical protein